MEEKTVTISISRKATFELYDVIGRLIYSYKSAKEYGKIERGIVKLNNSDIIFDVEADAMSELWEKLCDHR